MMKQQGTYSFSEEVINSSTHAAGVVMGLVVCICFLARGVTADVPLAGLSFGLYLFGVVSSYAASTIYHSIGISQEVTLR